MPPFEKIKHFFTNPDPKPASFAIKPVTSLLQTNKRQEFLDTIRSLLRMPDKYAELFFISVEQFAEFVQQLPENQHGLFSQTGEFLDHGLERATRTLALCLDYFDPKNINQKLSDNDTLWTYASFTAALLMDLGKIATKYRISLYDDQNRLLKLWNPYTGSMLNQDQAKTYHVDYVTENLDELCRLASALLARQILEQTRLAQHNGFHWISSNADILQAWLAIFYERERRTPMAPCMEIIPRANTESIRNYCENLNNIQDQFPDLVAFLKWFREGLRDRKISFSQTDSNAQVYLNEHEINVSAALLKEFSAQDSQYKNVNELARQFFSVMELYQISVSELARRYAPQGGLSSLNRIDYSLLGGISSIEQNKKYTNSHIITGRNDFLFFMIPQNLLTQLTPGYSPSLSLFPSPSPKKL